MENPILFRAVIEVLGKPKEHVQESMQGYLKKLRENKDFEVVSEELADLQKPDDTDLWATFAELEIKTPKVENITAFCFDYMPSIVEIIEPKEIVFTDANLSNYMNDLQARLHALDMFAKQSRAEMDNQNRAIATLMKNFIVILLKGRSLSAQELSNAVGVEKEILEDFLDQLIDHGTIDLKADQYYLKAEEKTVNNEQQKEG